MIFAQKLGQEEDERIQTVEQQLLIVADQNPNAQLRKFSTELSARWRYVTTNLAFVTYD